MNTRMRGEGASRTRYTRHTATRSGEGAGEVPHTDAEAWDMLSLGEDPSDEQRGV